MGPFRNWAVLDYPDPLKTNTATISLVPTFFIGSYRLPLASQVKHNVADSFLGSSSSVMQLRVCELG